MCGKLTEPKGVGADPFHLDHVVALENGGLDTDENCQVLCIPCHDKKTMKDMGYRERIEFDESGHVVW